MVRASEFISELKKNKLSSVIEVPCSIFKDLINYIIDSKEMKITTPVNEAVVMANAAGEYLATGKIPVVMMQNSGLNNSLNALSSLNRQYKIPVLYLISWRGEPGTKDAPEHDFMGPNLGRILDAYQVPFKVLSENYANEIKWAVSQAEQAREPTALIMGKGFIEKYEKKTEFEEVLPMDRWQAIETVVDNSNGRIYISTNGFPSRVLYNILKQRDKEDGRAFYMVGSMGHALGIGMGVAENVPKAKVVVIDGDGGALMHIGTMAGTVKNKHKNFVHIILDNSVYGSTGGQPTLAENIDFIKIGEGFGYDVYEAETKEELERAVKESLNNMPSLVHVKINKKERKEEEMIRVPYSCDEVRKRFSKYLSKFK